MELSKSGDVPKSLHTIIGSLLPSVGIPKREITRLGSHTIHKDRGQIGEEQTIRRIGMSKGNDKKTKSAKTKSKTTESAYKQAQSKNAATSIPFAKRIGAK